MSTAKTHLYGESLALFVLTTFLSLFLLSTPVLASPGNQKPDWQVSLHLDTDDASFGASYRLAGNWWLAGNLDHLGSGTSPRTSLSAVYEFPAGLLFFRFYGGVGIHDTMNQSINHYGLHTTVGSRLWFLFWEYEYPMQPNESTLFRSGIRLRF